MDKLQQLIRAIQILAIPAAMFRTLSIAFEDLGADDTKKRNQRIKNVIVTLILIELVTTLYALIKRYYV